VGAVAAPPCGQHRLLGGSSPHTVSAETLTHLDITAGPPPPHPKREEKLRPYRRSTHPAGQPSNVHGAGVVRPWRSRCGVYLIR